MGILYWDILGLVEPLIIPLPSRATGQTQIEFDPLLSWLYWPVNDSSETGSDKILVPSGFICRKGAWGMDFPPSLPWAANLTAYLDGGGPFQVL